MVIGKIQWDPLIQLWRVDEYKIHSVHKKSKNRATRFVRQYNKGTKRSPAGHRIKNGAHSGKQTRKKLSTRLLGVVKPGT